MWPFVGVMWLRILWTKMLLSKSVSPQSSIVRGSISPLCEGDRFSFQEGFTL